MSKKARRATSIKATAITENECSNMLDWLLVRGKVNRIDAIDTRRLLKRASVNDIDVSTYDIFVDAAATILLGTAHGDAARDAICK